MDYYKMDYYKTDELRHHGIKGQKWGRRQFQNKNGKYTPLGRIRYGIGSEKYGDNYAKYKNDYKKLKRTKITGTTTKARQKQVRNIASKGQLLREQMKDEKARYRVNKLKKKSKYRLKLEDKYNKEGRTPEEAELAADRRIRAEKMLAAAAITTAAVAAGKYYMANSDRTINANTSLQRISNETDEFHDAFYASKNKLDNIKYTGMIGENKNIFGIPVGTKNKHVFETTSKLNYAGKKTATKTLADLYSKDPEVKKYIDGFHANAKITPKQRMLLKRSKRHLNAKGVDKTVYDAFNVNGLIDDTVEGRNVQKKFYNELAKKGFNAIGDRNDTKYSGFNSIDPVIVFNAKDKIKKSSTSKLSMDEISKSQVMAINMIIGEALVKKSAAVGGVVAGRNAMNRRTASRKVEQYRKEHPNTKLSFNEIATMQ